jgi:hypothetical protein
MAYHLVTWYDTPSHPCHTYIYYCKPIKKVYMYVIAYVTAWWYIMHDTYISCQFMQCHDIHVWKNPFFPFENFPTLKCNFHNFQSFPTFKLYNFQFTIDLLICFGNSNENFLSIVVYSHSVSQSVRTQVGQNSWTCDDPKFQCSPKQFHTKRPDLVPTYIQHTFQEQSLWS